MCLDSVDAVNYVLKVVTFVCPHIFQRSNTTIVIRAGFIMIWSELFYLFIMSFIRQKENNYFIFRLFLHNYFNFFLHSKVKNISIICVNARPGIPGANTVTDDLNLLFIISSFHSLNLVITMGRGATKQSKCKNANKFIVCSRS